MRWSWMVRCYYAADVRPPKRPGELAIETVHATDSSKDMEVQAGRARADIGEIDVIPLSRAQELS